MGSTGSGKSTLVNSVAGSPVSQPGVLRPTTGEPVVWTGAVHAGRWWPGKVVVGDHPLADSVALIDTPDLDSDVIEHRSRAIDAIAAADAVVFVTTSSRYGDASPWEVLRSVAGKPLVVVVNRLQTRASGARNDLAARLRAEGMGSVPVLTISEQRINPERGRLKQQSVQRLAGVLRDWAVQDQRPSASGPWTMPPTRWRGAWRGLLAYLDEDGRRREQSGQRGGGRPTRQADTRLKPSPPLRPGPSGNGGAWAVGPTPRT